MKGPKNGNYSWKNMQSKAKEFFGENFWDDINQTIPKMGPNIDMYRKGSEAIVVLEVPGLSSRDRVGIRLRGSKLLLSGTIPWAYPISEDDILIKERFTGDFKREIELPFSVSSDAKVEAVYKNGIIEIHIPNDQSAEQEVEIKYDTELP